MCHYKPILNARTTFYFMDLPSFSQYPNAIHFCCFGFSFTSKPAENLNFRFNKYFSSNFSGTGTAHSGDMVSVQLFHFGFLRANSWARFAGPKISTLFRPLRSITKPTSRKAVPIYPLIDTFSSSFFYYYKK